MFVVCFTVLDLIVRSWADQRVLKLPLRSGIPSLFRFAGYGNDLHQRIGFMANQHFGARLVIAYLFIDHKNAAGQVGPASSLCAGWLSKLRGFMICHHNVILSWETVRARVGLPVGYFPPSEVSWEHRLGTGGPWIKPDAREDRAIACWAS